MGSEAVVNEAVFNGRYLLEAFLGDAELAASLLGQFIERSAAHLAALPALEREENWEEARRYAHTLKGSALTLSGNDLGEAALRLERLYKALLDAAASPPPAPAALPDAPALEEARAGVDAAFARFRAAAEAFLASLPGAAGGEGAAGPA